QAKRQLFSFLDKHRHESGGIERDVLSIRAAVPATEKKEPISAVPAPASPESTPPLKETIVPESAPEKKEEQLNPAQLLEKAVREGLPFEQVQARAEALNAAALAYVRAQKGMPVGGRIDAREQTNASMPNLLYDKLASALLDRPYTVIATPDPETQVILLKVERKVEAPEASAMRGVSVAEEQPRPTSSGRDLGEMLQEGRMREAIEAENAVVPQKVVTEQLPSAAAEARNADVQAPAPEMQTPQIPMKPRALPTDVLSTPSPSPLTLPRKPTNVRPALETQAPPSPDASRKAVHPKESFGEILQAFLMFLGENVPGLAGWLKKKTKATFEPEAKDTPWMVQTRQEAFVAYQKELTEIEVGLRNTPLSQQKVKELQQALAKTREKESILRSGMWRN
ncbi:MAG: hypothetical protein AAB728_03080, partial [Patescibacteria group bacterium]